jgi:hypothetical protein
MRARQQMSPHSQDDPIVTSWWMWQSTGATQLIMAAATRSMATALCHSVVTASELLRARGSKEPSPSVNDASHKDTPHSTEQVQLSDPRTGSKAVPSHTSHTAQALQVTPASHTVGVVSKQHLIQDLHMGKTHREQKSQHVLLCRL